MSAVTGVDEQSRTRDLARLSPLVLLAVAMPWLLERGAVLAVTELAPAYEPLVTGRLADAFLYPVVTGSVVLVGLYASLDPAARRSLFLFRRPSRRELLAVLASIPVGIALQFATTLVAISVFGAGGGATPGAGTGLRWLLTFLVVAGVFAPLVEEVLFRGLLLGYLTERGVPTLAAAGVVAVAFGAIHYYGGPAQVATATVWATVPIALRLRYDNLVSPVLCHSLTNLGALLVQFFLFA